VKCYIDNSVRLRSCIGNINKHFLCHCRGGGQHLLSVYRLHVVILTSIISLIDLSAALCLFMVFTRSCLTRFDLLANYHLDPESLIRKSRSRLSSPGSSGSHIREIVDKFQGSPTPHEPALMAAWRCINDFSAPSSANIRTGLEMNIGDGSFKLKLAHINMVQQSPFCGKASEDANAHLQHFLEIYNTFSIGGVTQDAVHLHDGSIPIRRQCQPRRSVQMHFSLSFFRWAKPLPCGTRSLGFSNSRMRPSPRHGNAYRIISLHAPITAWRSG
jgi:hypothetical protein